MYLSLPVKGNSAQSLTYRLAEEKDLPLLRQLRVECGWGVTKLEKHFENPNWVYVIFVLNEGKESAQDIGMGAWVLDDPSDSEVASRATRTVNINSLYIRPQHQRGGLGTTAMDILERVAAEKYWATKITLDTCAYAVTYVQEGDRRSAIEDSSKPGSTIAWYEKRGYRQYRPHQVLFPNATPTDPGYQVTVIFLAKYPNGGGSPTPP